MAFDLSTAKPVEPTRARFDLATAKPVEEEPPSRSLLGEAARQVGLTARAGLSGVSNIAGTVANAPAALANTMLDATGSTFRFNDQTQFGNRIADALGLPKPENAVERVAQDVASGMAGAGGIVKLGKNLAEKGVSELTKRIGSWLATAPGTQVISGGTGPGAASVVRESGGTPGEQMAAGVVGALAPAAATGLAEVTRRALRGNDGAKVIENLETFQNAGAKAPTIGQAGETRIGRAIESILAKSPGSAGRMAANAEGQTLGMGDKIDDIASALSKRTGAEPAGRAIKTGISNFVDDFKVQAGQHYDKLDEFLPKGSQVNVGKTQAALDTLTADIKGAPELSKFFQNSTIKAIKEAFEADTSGAFQGAATAPKGTLPYEAVKKLRTLVGDELTNSSLVSDVPRSKWKALYAALSEDMGSAAAAAGPQAEKALRRANRYYNAGVTRIDEVLDPIVSKADPEKVFNAALSGTKEGATTIRAVMKGLPQESRDVLSATMLRRLGKATPGQQDALGEVFSAETFLTNWNRMAPSAKETLFGNLPFGMRRDLNAIAKVAENMRDGAKVFANPSGSAQTGAAIGTAGGFVIALTTGNLPAAAYIASGVVGTNLLSRAMTNPKLVRWIAQSTKAPMEQLPAQLNLLFQQSLYMKGDERREVREFIKTVREASRGVQQQQQSAVEGQ